MKVEKDLILKALANVQDPDLRRDIVTLNMVKEIRRKSNICQNQFNNPCLPFERQH